MPFRKLTHRQEMRLYTIFLVLAWALALQAGSMGWILGKPWLYANAGLLFAVGLGLVWRLRHPRTRVEQDRRPAEPEPKTLDKLTCITVSLGCWMSAVTFGLTAWICGLPWLYFPARAFAAAGFAPLWRIHELRIA